MLDLHAFADHLNAAISSRSCAWTSQLNVVPWTHDQGLSAVKVDRRTQQITVSASVKHAVDGDAMPGPRNAIARAETVRRNF